MSVSRLSAIQAEYANCIRAIVFCSSRSDIDIELARSRSLVHSSQAIKAMVALGMSRDKRKDCRFKC